MTKKTIPHVDEAKNPDGTINHAVMEQHADHAMQQLKDGHYEIIQAGQQEIEPGVTKVWFLRREKNVDEVAAPHGLPTAKDAA